MKVFAFLIFAALYVEIYSRRLCRMLHKRYQCQPDGSCLMVKLCWPQKDAYITYDLCKSKCGKKSGDVSGSCPTCAPCAQTTTPCTNCTKPKETTPCANCEKKTPCTDCEKKTEKEKKKAAPTKTPCTNCTEKAKA